jgi:arginine-tRNA-protein transferase
VLVESPRPCSYLADQTASLQHQILLDVSAEELEAMLIRGHRRFGPDYFRPACEGCDQCVSTRVPVATFTPTKSQKRAAKACSELRVMMGPPRVDDERLALYRAWHATREDERGWSPSPLDAKGYFVTFAFPHPAGREISYYEGDRLVGIAISDLMPNALSLVYFFYDPAWKKRSIGINNVLTHIELARAHGIPHVYLGYRISNCASMRYKLGFRPQERLIGRPDDDEEPEWVLVDDTASPEP